jgi:hypothetical protein
VLTIGHRAALHLILGKPRSVSSPH